MGYVRVFMRSPRPDGLSSSEEFDALIGVEDSLREHFDDNGHTIYVGRNTSSGNRDFYFYTADVAAFEDTARTAMAAHPPYQFEIGNRPDPAWDVYFGFLYPSPGDLQVILNRRVIKLLESHGDDLAQPRVIDHVACLPNATAARKLHDYLSGLNFIVDEPSISAGSVALNFKRSDRPDEIDNVVVPIARHVQELGGEYDGWGCEVSK